jgi:hypothetical protein
VTADLPVPVLALRAAPAIRAAAPARDAEYVYLFAIEETGELVIKDGYELTFTPCLEVTAFYYDCVVLDRSQMTNRSSLE